MLKDSVPLLFFACLLCVPAPAHAQDRPADFAELEATVREELKAEGIPGAAVAVVSGDRVVFAKGFGVSDAEAGTAVTPDTLFRIASTTKMLTAAALVALAERGRVKLGEPVGTYVKGLGPRLARVTLHQLLSHTAGVRDGTSFYGPHDDAALAAFVSTWTDDYLVAEPGEVYSYSNLGYVLAARALEEATGKPYADAMDELVFRPLGMRRTTLRPTVAMTYPLAQGHDAPEGGAGAKVVRPFPDDARFWANGGVFTSASDFARFAVVILTNRTGGLLLKSMEKATEMFVPLRAKEPPPRREAVALTEAETRLYAGTYQNAPDYLRLELLAEGGKLFLRQAGQSEKSEVVRVGANLFSAEGQEFVLIPGAGGRPKFMFIAAHALRRM